MKKWAFRPKVFFLNNDNYYRVSELFKEIRIQNFQSIEDLTLKNMKNINIILGYNNSGKSSILKAINFATESYVLKQVPVWGKETSISPYLHSFEETIYNKDIYRDLKVTYTILYDKKLGEFYRKLENTFPNEIKLSFFMDIAQKSELTFEIKINNKNEINEYVFIGNKLIYSKEREKVDENIRGGKASFNGNLSSPDWQVTDENLQIINVIHDYIINVFKGIYLFITDRKTKEWSVLPKKWDRIGIHGEYVVSLLSYIRNSNDLLYDDICKSINKMSEDIKITKSPMNESGEVSIIHQSKNSSIDVNTIASGTGINQVIPLIIQLKYAQSGQLVLIEEPEISLHPDAQEQLAKIIIEEANKGKQIICTTHSDTIPFRFWIATMKDKVLSPNSVKAYITSKIDGKTKISESTLEKALDIVYYPKDINL
jgi:predicted ATPase